MHLQQVDWFAARSSGFVAWALVTTSVLYGLLHASRATTRARPAWLLDLHSSIAALACIFTLVHIGALLLDSFIGFGAREILIPFASRYKPAAVAWGIVAMYLMLSVQATSLWMRHLPRRLWHVLHLGSFLVFAATTLHMLQAGTDRRSPYVHAVAAIALVAVGVATTARVIARGVVRSRHARRRLLLHARVGLAPRTLADVDTAIEELVRSGTTHRRDLASGSRHPEGVPRNSPR